VPPAPTNELDPIQVAEATRTIAVLRQKLLDLSKHNRLLNFNHNPQARGHIRIIDEIPEFLLKEIEKGKSFGFKALPRQSEGSQNPKDEETDEFKIALDDARNSDDEYNRKIESLEEKHGDDKESDAFQDAQMRLERTLRDSVRATLGMPTLKSIMAESLSKWAKRHGINPSFELPDPNTVEEKPEHSDSFLQTLHLPDEMNVKLGKVFEIANQAINEKGVNTLYVAFGFLEWIESDSSEKSLYAPLLLLPVQIEKEVKRGEMAYSISATGDDRQTNITLAARLKQDFGIVLPSIGDDEGFEDYISKVAKVINNRNRWRIHRYVTAGHFAFARLVMYNDLDEKNWPDDRKPSRHSVAKEMFGGRNGSSVAGFREVYNPDDQQYQETAPSLVVDADSSQFSAVVDAVSGENLVIQGPPGTGKSQTITNIIAATIESGKTVLFVAEKMAALNVVKSRLESVGLGEFCLELHSTKATKQSVMAAFKRRLEKRMGKSNIAPQETLDELADAKEKMNDYLSLLKQTFGETGLRINQVLWRAHSKSETILPDVLRKVAIDDAEFWSAVKIGRVEQYFANLTDAERGLEQTPKECVWGFIRSPNLTPIDFPIIEGWISTIIELTEKIESLVREIGPSQTSLHFRQVEELIQWVDKLELPMASEEQQIYDILVEEKNLVAVNSHHDLKGQLRVINEQLIRWFSPKFVPAKENVSKLCDLIANFRQLEIQGICLISDLNLHADKMTSLADRIESSMALLEKVCRAVRVTTPERNATTIDSLLDLAKLISTTPDEILEDRSNDRLAPDAQGKLAVIEAEFNSLQSESSRLVQQLSFDPNILDARTVTLHKAVLQKRSIFRIFNREYREARKFARSLFLPNPLPSDSAVIIALESIGIFINKRDSFFDSSTLKTLSRSISGAANFDFERIRKTIIWGQKVRRIFGDDSSFGVALRQFLFDAPSEDIKSAREFFTADIISQLESLANESRSYLDKIDKAPSELRNQAKDLRGLHFIADDLSLNKNCSSVDLINAKEVCSLSIEVSERSVIELSKIRTIFGNDELDIIIESIERMKRLRADIKRSILPKEIADSILSKGGLPHLFHAKEKCKSLADLLVTFSKTAERLEGIAQFEKSRWQKAKFEDLRAPLILALSSRSLLPHWCSWLRACSALREDKVDSLSQLLEAGIPARVIFEHLKHVISRSMARRAHEIYPRLRKFTGVTLTEAQRRVRTLDGKLKEFACAKVFLRAFQRAMYAPAGNGSGSVKTYTEMALIRHQTSLQRPNLAIRDFLSRAGESAQALMPCFMMSPMSVAQFLKNDGVRFDVVIFDEASQVLPEDAIGAISRGNRVVVVGDQMQLPPTDFFQKAETGSLDDMDEEEAAAIQGMESILDKALSVYQPARRLLWHYRSKDPRLIAFSNREFYDNALQLFPAPHTTHSQLGIKIVEAKGVYGGRCNPIEADVIAEAAVDFMRKHPGRSLGVVALNSQQRDIIEAKVDRLIATDVMATKYRQKWLGTLEPFFVKNLENVQGDERDVIFISTVFGKDVAGNMYQRFGPLNSSVGHRRLNVLFTRAKESVIIYTSLSPEDIQIEESSSWGRKVFKNYLEYARSGRLETGIRTDREPDSDFEVIVRERLRVAGYEVDSQIGISGYFVDLGVRHPKYSAHYLLGVECDGATYHSFKSARDRDRLRQDILEKLGWNIHRIWSTDWFHNPEREMNKLISAIRIQEEAFSNRQEFS